MRAGLGALIRKSVNPEALTAISTRLGDAAVDPTVWPELLNEISTAVGAAGAALLQSDIRTFDIPRSAGADEVISYYFESGWYENDIRAQRGVPLLLRGEKVIIDQDIVTPEEMASLGFYAENLAPFGFQWFAAVAFWSGSALWGLSIQRTAREGSFDNDDKHVLSQLSQRLSEAATLSKAVGRAVITGVTNALHLVKRPALALDRFGFVLEANLALDQILDDEIRIKDRRLHVSDQRARSALDSFITQSRTIPDTAALAVEPIVVRRRAKQPVVIRILPIDGAARSPFLGARALMVFSDLNQKFLPRAALLSQAFGLSPAEARLASLLASGISPEHAAEQLGVARETVRNQLKAIFAKTDTHRQGELIALISQL